MAHLSKIKSWTVIDYDKFIEEIGGYRKSTTTEALKYFLDSENTNDPEVIKKAVDNFLRSQDLFINSKHFE